jgi:hypothetical protein
MTFAAEQPGEILSQDARGRVLVSRERRESLLEEYDRSRMSAVKFAQYVGIKYSTLAYWCRSVRKSVLTQLWCTSRLLQPWCRNAWFESRNS